MDFKEIDLKEYIKILLRQRRILTSVFLVIFIFTAFYTLLTPKTYEAKAAIIFNIGMQPSLASIGGISVPIGGSSTGGSSSGGMGISSLFGPLVFNAPTGDYNKLILESRNVREKLIEKLNLYSVYKTKSAEAALKALDKNTKIEFDKFGLLTIKARAKSPNLAADIANTYLDLLVDYNNKNSVSRSKNRREFIEKQLAVKKEELKTAEENMRKFSQAHKILDYKVYSEELLKRWSFLEEMEIKNEVDLNQTNMGLSLMKNKMIAEFGKSYKDVYSLPFSKDRIIEEWRVKLFEKQYSLLLALQSYTQKHPKVLQAKGELEEVKNTMRKQIQESVKSLKTGVSPDLIGLETDLLIFEAQSKAIKKAKEELGKKMSKLPNTVFEYLNLERELKIKNVLVAMLEQDLESARIAEAGDAPALEILDRPSKPEHAVAPRFKLNILIGAFMGIIFGILAAFVSEYIDKSEILKEKA